MSAEQIRQAFKKLGTSDKEPYSKVCTAKNISANPTTGIMTCDCEPIDGTAILQDVRLSADFNSNSTTAGLILVPKDGSIVIVSFLNIEAAYVSMVSEVDYIYLNGNNYGGLIKVTDLVTHLNTIENKINSLITAITAWTPVAGDGGAALKTALTTWLGSSITPTVRANLESTYVNHGDGTLI